MCSSKLTEEPSKGRRMVQKTKPWPCEPWGALSLERGRRLGAIGCTAHRILARGSPTCFLTTDRRSMRLTQTELREFWVIFGVRWILMRALPGCHLLEKARWILPFLEVVETGLCPSAQALSGRPLWPFAPEPYCYYSCGGEVGEWGFCGSHFSYPQPLEEGGTKRRVSRYTTSY